jgi:sugar phosphate permease
MSQKDRTTHPIRHFSYLMLPSLVVLLGSMFYVYEFFLRVIPSVITHELMRDFHANATSLGFMSASFYYAYAFMQIPAGILCDRFGPRLILTIAACICAIATVTFAHTDSLFLAGLARFAIGIASSCGFIAPVLLASRWFDSQYYSMITGLIQTLGSVGAIIGGGPIALVIQNYGWRHTMIMVAMVAVFLAFLFIIGIRNHPKRKVAQPQKKLQTSTTWDNVKIITSSKQTWCIAFISMCCWAPIALFELWGVPFLCTWHHCSASVAAKSMLWLWLGIAFWSPIVGRWSNLIKSRKTPLTICAIVGFITSIIVVYNPTQSWPIMKTALFMLGFSAAAQPVTFGVINDLHHPKVAGTAVGFNNMATIAGGPILQPLTGIMLSLLWDHKMLDHAPVYSLHAYHEALSIIPITCIAGYLLVRYVLTETNCLPKHNEQ